mmetsp:Transcript_28234/g.47856  ORF Transcript_28234/g.47856 Transcript_28234/m.47856 type:complete len:602 (-) Transcript_28234:96-1901(-)
MHSIQAGSDTKILVHSHGTPLLSDEENNGNRNHRQQEKESNIIKFGSGTMFAFLLGAVGTMLYFSAWDLWMGPRMKKLASRCASMAMDTVVVDDGIECPKLPTETTSLILTGLALASVLSAVCISLLLRSKLFKWAAAQNREEGWPHQLNEKYDDDVLDTAAKYHRIIEMDDEYNQDEIMLGNWEDLSITSTLILAPVASSIGLSIVIAMSLAEVSGWILVATLIAFVAISVIVEVLSTANCYFGLAAKSAVQQQAAPQLPNISSSRKYCWKFSADVLFLMITTFLSKATLLSDSAQTIMMVGRLKPEYILRTTIVALKPSWAFATSCIILWAIILVGSIYLICWPSSVPQSSGKTTSEHHLDDKTNGNDGSCNYDNDEEEQVPLTIDKIELLFLHSCHVSSARSTQPSSRVTMSIIHILVATFLGPFRVATLLGVYGRMHHNNETTLPPLGIITIAGIVLSACKLCSDIYFLSIRIFYSEDNDGRQESTEQQIVSEDRANIFSRFTFWWVTPVLTASNDKGRMEEDDIPLLPRYDSPKKLYSALTKVFRERYSKGKNALSGVAMFATVLCRIQPWTFFTSLINGWIFLACMFIDPIILRW